MNNNNLSAVLQTAITERKIDTSQVNLMLPTQTFGEVMGQYDKLTIEVVEINPDKDAGEVYEITKGKKSLGKVPIQKIGNALGVIWDPDRTTILESTSTKARAKATGAIRKPNGEWIVLSEEKTVDLEAIEEEQRIKQEEYAAKGKLVRWDNGRPVHEPWSKFGGEKAKLDHIDLEVRKSLLPYKKFKDERAMTGAKERVIKALIAIKDTYTDAELSKPFAFPRVLPDVNKMLADPAIRQAAIDRMIGSQHALFGPGQGNTERDLGIYGDSEREQAEGSRYELEHETQQKQAQEEKPEEEKPDDFEDDIPWDEDTPDIVRQHLQHYVDNKEIYLLSPKGIDFIQSALSVKNATLRALQDCEKRIKDYIAGKEHRDEKYAAHMKKMREEGKL